MKSTLFKWLSESEHNYNVTFQKAFTMQPQGKISNVTERLSEIPEQINSPFNITEVFINCQSFYFFWCLSSVKYKLCTQISISLAPSTPPGTLYDYY